MNEEFWVYVNQPNNYALIHEAKCSFCNNGKGIQNSDSNLNGQWYGSFNRITAEKQALKSKKRDIKWCGHCAKKLGIDIQVKNNPVNFIDKPKLIKKLLGDLSNDFLSEIPVIGGIIKIGNGFVNFYNNVCAIRMMVTLEAVLDKISQDDDILSADEIEILIDNDTTYFLKDVLQQSTLTASKRLQILLGIIYARYIKSNTKEEKNKYLKIYKSISNIQEQDLDILVFLTSEVDIYKKNNKKNIISNQISELNLYYGSITNSSITHNGTESIDFFQKYQCSYNDILYSIEVLKNNNILSHDSASYFGADSENAIRFLITNYSQEIVELYQMTKEI